MSEKTQITEKKKQSKFVQNVLRRLNLSDEGKIGEFENLAVKEWRKQVKLYKKQLKTMEESHHEKMDDLYEELEEVKEERLAAFETIEPEAINTLNDRKDYLLTYNNKIDKAIQKVKNKEVDIEDEQEDFESDSQRIKDAIEHFEFKLHFIE